MNKGDNLLVSVLWIVLGIVVLYFGVTEGFGFVTIIGILCLLLGAICVWTVLSTPDAELKEMQKRSNEESRLSNWEYKNSAFYFDDKCIRAWEISNISVDVGVTKLNKSYLNINCKNGKKYRLTVPQRRLEEAINLQPLFALDKISSSYGKNKNDYSAEDRDKLAEFLTTDPSLNPKKEEKDASVVGRAVAGQIIAGPTGAIVGALSAVDHNNKNKK